jgi:hypothetical protein
MDCCNNEQKEQDGQNKDEVIQKSPTVKPHTIALMDPWKAATLVLSTTLVLTLAFGALVGTGTITVSLGAHDMNAMQKSGGALLEDETTYESIVPLSVTLPVTWGDIGMQMLETGVIDETKFTELSDSRGGMSDMTRAMLHSTDVSDVVMTKENANDLLNLFWAFGLSNKNTILENGPMVDEQYGGDPSGFASTGGWPLSTGSITDHYSAHSFVTLTAEQQTRVENVSKGIFRPCCNNAVYFPDCNHGMAMLGLLELLAANDMSEADMFSVALGVNIYWFPDTYLTIAQFFDKNDLVWNDIAPKEIIGMPLSSATGFGQVKASITQPTKQQEGGGGCSV